MSAPFPPPTRALSQALNIQPFLAEALIRRGIDTLEKARVFFTPDYARLHNPFLMKGMTDAVAHIYQSLEKNKKILIYGDYDVDGVCSVTILKHFFDAIGNPTVRHYIPNRFSEGYGTTDKGIATIIAEKIDVVITVDCGIRSRTHIGQLRDAGITTIITDHHLPKTEYFPDAAIAVLNPHQPDCPYPYKDLCGAGIAFKLIQGLCLKHFPHISPMNFIAFACIGTIGDMMPLNGENRTLCHLGLQQLRRATHPALQDFIQFLKNKNSALSINSDLIGFYIAPAINAAGRMDSAEAALSVFLEKDKDKRMAALTRLYEYNETRKNLQKAHTLRLCQKSDTLAADSPIIIIEDAEISKGIMGLIAGNLCEHSKKPVIVLTSKDCPEGYLAGSARSTEYLDITQALNESAEYLDHFGGHAKAAGLSLLKEKLPSFIAHIQKIALNNTRPPDPTGTSAYIPADPKKLSLKQIAVIERMAPFGIDNPEPVFISPPYLKSEWNAAARILKDQHLQINTPYFKAIGFGLGAQWQALPDAASLQLVFYLRKESWQGIDRVQLFLLSLLVSDV